MYNNFGDVNIMHQMFALIGIFTVYICMYIVLVSIYVCACVCVLLCKNWFCKHVSLVGQ